MALLNGDPTISQWLAQYPTLCVPAPVLGELLFGALNSTRPVENVARIDRLTASSRVLDVTSPTARTYAEVRLDLKLKGRPIPENDIWIAACCAEHAVPLATRDAHFSHVIRLTVLPPP